MALKRLDTDARAIVDLANDIAHEYGLEYVGTEHILLAILRYDRGAGAKALHNLGVTEPRVREAIAEMIQRAKEDTWVFGRLPGSPHYRAVIERAMEIAEQLEAHEIGSEHLLLALYNDEESTGRQVLRTLNVNQKKCRDEILRLLSTG